MQGSCDASTSRLPSGPETNVFLDKGKAKAVEVTESCLKRLAGLAVSPNPLVRFETHRLQGNKAGLKRDPEEVRNLIYEASKGSAFFINEQKRDAATSKQVEAMLLKLNSKIDALGGDLSKAEAEMDRLIARLEASCGHDIAETVVVVDADAFFASVEELDNPELRGKAFAVGSSVLATASYEARKFGCRSAMAGFVARKLCPELIFVKPDYKKYSAASEKIMDILRCYDENMAPASLDEAYLNISAYLKQSGQTAAEVVEEMRARVKRETGLTVSAGIAPNKMLAKIAADVNKPDGQCLVPPDRDAMKAFIQPLSVRKIPGVGRVMERWLEALGVVKIKDLFAQRGKLCLVREQLAVDFLFKSFLGLGSCVVEAGKREDRKSVGRESTFATLHKEEDLLAKLSEIAKMVTADLERLHFTGRTVTLKLKEDTYEPSTRSHTDAKHTFYSTYEDLYRIGKELLEHELEARRQRFGKKELRLRLMGLRVTNLRDELKRHQSLDQWAKPTSPVPQKRKQVFEAEPEVVDSVKPARSKVKRLSASDHVLENVTCPSCSKVWREISTSQFNTHLDGCLSGSGPLRKKKNQTKAAGKPSAFSVLMKGAGSVGR